MQKITKPDRFITANPVGCNYVSFMLALFRLVLSVMQGSESYTNCSELTLKVLFLSNGKHR